jgi:hypothetical protein
MQDLGGFPGSAIAWAARGSCSPGSSPRSFFPESEERLIPLIVATAVHGEHGVDRDRALASGDRGGYRQQPADAEACHHLLPAVTQGVHSGEHVGGRIGKRIGYSKKSPASSHGGCLQRSRSPSVVKITGMAFGKPTMSSRRHSAFGNHNVVVDCVQEAAPILSFSVWIAVAFPQCGCLRIIWSRVTG